MVAKLEVAGADIQILHSALIARFFGERKEEEFRRAKDLLSAASRDPNFEGFYLGSAEGTVEHQIDDLRIAGDAFKNARKG